MPGDILLKALYCLGSIGIILLKFRGLLELHTFSVAQVVASSVLLIGVAFTKNRLFLRIALLYGSLLVISALLLIAFAWMGGTLGKLGLSEVIFAVCALTMTISALGLTRQKVL